MKIKLIPFLEEYKNKIDYCYLGVDTKEFYYKGCSEKFEVYKNKILIGSCSRIIYEKGYKEMANIVKSLIDSNLDVIWIIAGDGIDKRSLEKYVNELKIENNVKFLGALNFEQLNDFYSSVDIFILLSNYDEVFPLVYIEAQICGAVAIGRNRGRSSR